VTLLSQILIYSISTVSRKHAKSQHHFNELHINYMDNPHILKSLSIYYKLSVYINITLLYQLTKDINLKTGHAYLKYG